MVVVSAPVEPVVIWLELTVVLSSEVVVVAGFVVPPEPDSVVVNADEPVNAGVVPVFPSVTVSVDPGVEFTVVCDPFVNGVSELGVVWSVYDSVVELVAPSLVTVLVFSPGSVVSDIFVTLVTGFSVELVES